MISGPDTRNPLVHMTLWNFIATGGLLLILLILNGLTPEGQSRIFADWALFLFGALFWAIVAFIAGICGGVSTGGLLWFFTLSARVTERSVIYYYVQVWLQVGLLLGITNSLIAWWYANSGVWTYFLWTDAPRPRDAIFAVLWLVVVPMIGATRFIDSLYVETRQKRR